AAMANEVAEVAQARVPEGLRLVVDARADLPAIAADADKLRQVLANLLDNAVKYSPDGGTIEFEASRSGGRVRFRISDEGLGIPPAEQDRVFEEFFRLDPNLTRGVGGPRPRLFISPPPGTRVERAVLGLLRRPQRPDVLRRVADRVAPLSDTSGSRYRTRLARTGARAAKGLQPPEFASTRHLRSASLLDTAGSSYRPCLVWTCRA